MTTDREDSETTWRLAWLCYALATVVWITGIGRAAQHYPGSYDWTYTVISALASRKHNPGGAAWFAGAMVAAMLLLWPVVRQVTRRRAPGRASARWPEVALRIGLLGTAIVGGERLAFLHLSSVVRKGHELLALLAFLGFYAGIIGLYVQRVRARASSLLPAIVVVAPLVAVGLRELMLYAAQRGAGWADRDWRGAGTPLWFSFALWQWLAAILLWGALGHLLFTSRRRQNPRPGITTAIGGPSATDHAG